MVTAVIISRRYSAIDVFYKILPTTLRHGSFCGIRIKSRSLLFTLCAKRAVTELNGPELPFHRVLTFDVPLYFSLTLPLTRQNRSSAFDRTHQHSLSREL